MRAGVVDQCLLASKHTFYNFMSKLKLEGWLPETPGLEPQRTWPILPLVSKERQGPRPKGSRQLHPDWTEAAPEQYDPERLRKWKDLQSHAWDISGNCGKAEKGAN